MKIVGIFITTILIVSLCAIADENETSTLRILHLNDIHSHMLPYPYAEGASQYGGMARTATLINSLRDENTLVLNAGDMLVGDLMYAAVYDPPSAPIVGYAEFFISNLMGFDAFVVGNHEFDATPAMFAAVLNHPNIRDNLPPILCANIQNLEEAPELVDIIKPYVIVEKNGINVGIIGFLTPETNTIANPAPLIIDNIWEGDINDLLSVTPKSVYQDMINDLREEGADIVIALTHLGTALDVLLGQLYYGIDVIIGGHSHSPLPPVEITSPTGQAVPYVRAGAYMRWLGSLTLTLENNQIIGYEYEALPIHEEDDDPAIAAAVNQFKMMVEAKWPGAYTDVVREIPFYMEGLSESARGIDNAETNLGNLITDAMRAATGTQIAIEAAGVIRQSILAGANTAADIYRVVGQGFNPATGANSLPLVTVSVPAFNLAGALEYSVSIRGNFFFQVSGISFEYDATKPSGEKVDPATIRINGEPINWGASYTATVNQYVAGFGVALGFISEAGIQPTEHLLFDALLEYVTSTDISQYEGTQGRIVDTSDPVSVPIAGSDLPADYSLQQNYPNPFNPTTTIVYSIPSSEMVTLRVYNILGQEVATLVDKVQESGTYMYTFDSAHLPSGVYLYRLQAGDFAETKRMSVIK
jgi:5'-nucleotidase / UDP-sugar diphosphatase